MRYIEQINIENMLALWRSYGANEIPLSNNQLFSSLNWPNKIWVNDFDSLRESDRMKTLVINFLATHPQHKLVTWSKNEHRFASSLELASDAKIKHNSSLIGMSLDISGQAENDRVQQTPLIDSHLVTQQDIKFWCNLSGKGFGYTLDSLAALSANKHWYNNQYWYSVNDRPVGTALTTSSGDVMGFHQITVLPEWRGKGIALAIVNQLINCAIFSGAHRAVLQASPMGLSLYKKLGFSEDFELRNYGYEV